MAGRPPLASSSSSQIHDPSTSQSPPFFQSGTYVVQIPKDQIYRIPPPENAQIVERYRNPEQKKKTSFFSSWFCCFIIILLVTVAVGLIIGNLFSYQPKNPEFQIHSFDFKNPSQSHYKPYYYSHEITLTVYNPNGNSDILYMKGGIASLFSKEAKLAAGKFPNFHQDDKNSTEITLTLKGSNINASSKPKGNVSFSLKIDSPVRMKISHFKTGNTKLDTSCHFTVDKLGKGSLLLSQQCQTDRN